MPRIILVHEFNMAKRVVRVSLRLFPKLTKSNWVNRESGGIDHASYKGQDVTSHVRVGDVEAGS